MSTRQYRLDNPTKQLMHSARSRAKKRGIDFNIDETDIIIPDRCPILDIPLCISTRKSSNNSPTLDQVIQGLGYTKGNVRVISHKANTMKQDHTIESMEKFILYMKGHL